MAAKLDKREKNRFIICSKLPAPGFAEMLTICQENVRMVAPICEEVNHTHGKEKH